MRYEYDAPAVAPDCPSERATGNVDAFTRSGSSCVLNAPVQPALEKTSKKFVIGVKPCGFTVPFMKNVDDVTPVAAVVTLIGSSCGTKPNVAVTL